MTAPAAGAAVFRTTAAAKMLTLGPPVNRRPQFSLRRSSSKMALLINFLLPRSSSENQAKAKTLAC